MKYLSDYIDPPMTAIYDDIGAFFAFSNEQFDEAKKDGVEYSSLGSGLICPKGKEEELINRLDKVFSDGIKQDLEENGKEGVIIRELYNHEIFITWDITDTVRALEGYGITEKEVEEQFVKEQIKRQNKEDDGQT